MSKEKKKYVVYVPPYIKVESMRHHANGTISAHDRYCSWDRSYYDIFSGAFLYRSSNGYITGGSDKDKLRCLLTALLHCKHPLLCKGIYDPRVFLLVFKFINQRNE